MQPNQSPDQQPSVKPEQKTKKPWVSWLYVAIIVVLAAGAFGAVWLFAEQTDRQNTNTQQNQPTYTPPKKSTEVPKLNSEVVLGGRKNIWEIAFLPTKEMLFTERSGMLSILKDGQATQLVDIQDVRAIGEGGLTGLAVDPSFKDNRYVYTCFNSNQGGPDVRVVRWKVKEDLSGLEDRNDIVTGIPAVSGGRHSGCRLAFGPNEHLWIGTGDAAMGDTGVRPNSLGGKVLRVDRDGRAIADNNPSDGFDARIYSYGHRNVQGLAFYKRPVNGVVGVSIEHGSTVDDEVNLLQKGNFGWAPPASGYNESGVPMTDKARFPNAVDAIWSSGNPTQAPSGATFVNGRQWKAWDGSLVVAMLKAAHLKFLTIQDNKVIKEDRVFEGSFGRIRTAVQGPDGNLYVSTDNGNDDKVVRIIPN